MSSSSKVQMIGKISSIFLRRLLHPGVLDSGVLQSTFELYGKHWDDNEFKALTFDELRTEILMLVEREDIGESPLSTFKCWKEFCSRYFHQWCKSSAPLNLLFDTSSEVVGVIRQNGISVFCSFQNIELLMYGTLEFPDFGADAKILFELLKWTKSLKQHLDPVVLPIFYESIVGALPMSGEDIVPLLLKTMLCGYNFPTISKQADFFVLKKLGDRISLKEFIVSSVTSLNAQCMKSSGWVKVLDVMESYVKLLAPSKPTEKSDADIIFDINPSLIVQATSQAAGLIFESAMDILFFMSYLLDISSQVHMLPDDISRIKQKLVPMIHEIIFEWFTIHYLNTVPFDALSREDLGSLLSSQRSCTSNSWNRTLSYLSYILYSEFKFKGEKNWNLSLPNPRNLINLVHQSSGWIVWGKFEEKSVFVHQIKRELALSLLGHGRYDASEDWFRIVEHFRSKRAINKESSGGEWCLLDHVRGCCLLAQNAKHDLKIQKPMKP